MAGHFFHVAVLALQLTAHNCCIWWPGEFSDEILHTPSESQAARAVQAPAMSCRVSFLCFEQLRWYLAPGSFHPVKISAVG